VPFTHAGMCAGCLQTSSRTTSVANTRPCCSSASGGGVLAVCWRQAAATWLPLATLLRLAAEPPAVTAGPNMSCPALQLYRTVCRTHGHTGTTCCSRSTSCPACRHCSARTACPCYCCSWMQRRLSSPCLNCTRRRWARRLCWCARGATRCVGCGWWVALTRSSSAHQNTPLRAVRA
jgi:hypothetical protein